MYLILTPSPYTENDMLNYKSLDSYQNFVKGWVREVLVKAVGNKRVVIGKVNHSQRLSEKPLTPWIISMKEGKILVAHCDCMAGLGESCSHMASLLWVLAVGVENRDALTVTQKTAYWVLPPVVRSVPYLRIKEVEFIGKKKYHSGMTLGSTVAQCSNVQNHVDNNDAGSTSTSKQRKLDAPSQEEKTKFLDSLATMSSAKPGVLSVLPGYCDMYIPCAVQQSSDLFPLLTDLYDSSYLTLNYFDLLQLASTTAVNITDEQCTAVERNTREQSKSNLWFRVRAGRIIASKFKAVCHTDPASPSLSLVIGICHPDTVHFKTAATVWGCQHEQDALKEYEAKAGSHHDQLSVSPAGFFICQDRPYFGASPDGMVCCFCCGPGICEVKIQAQLTCTGVLYCDFVVYTENELYIERIYPDVSFMEEKLIKVKHFFNVAVLPELLSRWFSRPLPDYNSSQSSLNTSSVGTSEACTSSTISPSFASSPVTNTSPSKYCYCQQGEYGKMVGCDGSNCPYQWFHLNCLKLKTLPKSSKWYCPDCRKLN